MARLVQFGGALALSVSVFQLYACGSDDFEPNPSNTGGKDAGNGGSGGSAGSTSGGSAGTAGGGGTSATGGSSATGGTGGDAGPTCPTGHQCVAPAPSGWSGPVLKSAACGGSWAQSELVVHEGLSAPAAQCACNCAPGVDCPDNVVLSSFNQLACSGGFLSNQNMVGCQPKVGLSQSISMPAAQPTCAATVAETIPALAWATDSELCGGAIEGGSCDGTDLCLPNDGGDICVYQAGDVACPPEYPNETQVFTGATDTRDSPATCTCTPSGTATCTTTVFTYTGAQCTAAPSGPISVTSGASPQCLPNNVMNSASGAINAATMGTCTGSAVTATGSATATGVHTVCCAGT